MVHFTKTFPGHPGYYQGTHDQWPYNQASQHTCVTILLCGNDCLVLSVNLKKKNVFATFWYSADRQTPRT